MLCFTVDGEGDFAFLKLYEKQVPGFSKNPKEPEEGPEKRRQQKTAEEAEQIHALF